MIDLRKQQFGKLTVIDRHQKSHWTCRCECGNTHIVRSDHLKEGKVVSCGCVQRQCASKIGKMNRRSLVGKTFGRLTVNKRYNKRYWLCQCTCGFRVVIFDSSLTQGTTKSCGCLRSECARRVHPNFNPTACQRIDVYGKLHGYQFQHALNGGEVQIGNYWVDGYDRRNNVVIEFYERYHRTKKQKSLDAHRKQEIIERLNCKFIEIIE